MANATLTVADRFPVGTSVAAYPEANWPAHRLPPSGAPVGASAATAAVAAAGTVAFTGLAYGTRYRAYALVAGQHRYVAFRTAEFDESRPPVFSAHRSTAFSATTGGAFQRLPMNSLDYDEGAASAQYDSANGQFICREAGLYSVIAGVSFDANVTGQRLLAVRINAADAFYDHGLGHATLRTQLYVATQLVLDPGQAVDVAVYQDSGVSLGVLLAAIIPTLRLAYIAPKPVLL